MKAAQIKGYSDKDIIEIKDDVKKPIASENHVIVQTKAAGVNPVDWKIKEGYMKEMAPLEFPATLGGDFSGVITEVGKGITKFKRGDEVYGTANPLAGNSGSFAEFISTDADSIAVKPKSIDFKEAAALPLVGISAFDVIYNKIKLSKGQKILIHGGAGGIGSIAIQIAKNIGAYVATTVSSKDIEFAKNLGADFVIDYKTQDFEDLIKDYDAVFDNVGGDTYTKSFKVLKPKGMIVSMLAMPDETLAEQFKVSAEIEIAAPAINTQNLARLARLVDDGVVKVHIDKSFSLDEANEALDYQKTGHPSGKVVIEA